jgi:hypothetical protein
MVAFPRNVILQSPFGGMASSAPYAKIGKPQRALTHIRTAATRGSVVIIAGPRHLWEENWKAKVMAFFSLKHSASCLKTAVLASGLLLISTQGHAEPGWEGPFLGLSGHWSGAGTVTMTDGATERIRCKAAYAVNATGKAVQQTLRCASDSYRFEISSNVISEGGSLSGSWAEATRGASGNISGRASGAEIVVNVAGAGFTAHLDLRTQGDRQSVTIRPQGGTDVTAVSIALRKG